MITIWYRLKCRCDKILIRVYNSEKTGILLPKLLVEDQTSTIPGRGAGHCQQRFQGDDHLEAEAQTKISVHL